MSDEKQRFNLASAKEMLNNVLGKLKPYAFLMFLVFVGVLYAFIVLRINNLSSQQPTTLDINNQINAAQLPHIDQSVVNQLQSLQDNSVNVQTLFNQARDNPFQ